MAIRATNSWISTNIPGAYVNTVVRSVSGGVANTGVVAIIGEAERGSHFGDEILANNAFGPDQVSAILAKYGSGPIVEAAQALAAPSNDPDITGAPNSIVIVKTNKGTKASAEMADAYCILKAKNFGKYGNKLAYQVDQSQSEAAPMFVGKKITAFGATLDGTKFSLRFNGGVATEYTLGTGSGHDDITELVLELKTLIDPTESKVVFSDGGDNNIVITIIEDPASHKKGWGKTFEIIDSTPGEIPFLGLEEGLFVSAAEDSIEFTVTDTATQFQESFEVEANIALTIGYDGTTALADLTSAGKFKTTVVGGSGADLDLDLKDFATLKAFADYIHSQPGYTAKVDPTLNSKTPKMLDTFTAVGIASSIDAMPGRFKTAAYEFKKAFEGVVMVEPEMLKTEGLPDLETTMKFLAGGSKGGTTSNDITDALLALEGVRVNMVVPLFSRDAIEDISDEDTEAGSTYTIDAIHAATKAHCLKLSTPKMKRRRTCFLSYKGDFVDAKAKVGGLASFRASLAIQDAQVGDQVYQPWYLATVAAGIQAAGMYKAIFNKVMNVTSVIDPVGFDSGSPGFVSQALDASLLIAENTTAGSKFVSDQTTYGIDDNFVYNSIQAVYAADLVATDLGDFIGNKFTGKSLADVDGATVASAMTERLTLYRRMKLITSSDDATLGYRNINVEINGPIVYISVEIKLSTAIYFELIDIEISQVKSEA